MTHATQNPVTSHVTGHTAVAAVHHAPIPPLPGGRRVLLVVGVLLWLAVAVLGPPGRAHAAAGDSLPASGGKSGEAGGSLLRPLPTGGTLADVLRRFDPPPVRWAAGHRGVDLAAPVGAPVRSVRAGVVSYVGVIAGKPVVAVELAGTGAPPLRTTFEPVEAKVTVGQAVGVGTVLGTLAARGGHCPASCLHWGLLRGRHYLDPLALVAAGQARLLPLAGGAGRAGQAGRAA